MQRVVDDGVLHVGGHPRAPSSTLGDLAHTGQTLGLEAAPPRPHRVRRHADLPCRLVDGHTVGGQQQRPGPQHRAMRKRRRAGHQFQGLPILLRHDQRIRCEHRHHAASIGAEPISATDH